MVYEWGDEVLGVGISDGWYFLLLHASGSWIAISEEAHEQYINVNHDLGLCNC